VFDFMSNSSCVKLPEYPPRAGISPGWVGRIYGAGNKLELDSRRKDWDDLIVWDQDSTIVVIVWTL